MPCFWEFMHHLQTMPTKKHPAHQAWHYRRGAFSEPFREPALSCTCCNSPACKSCARYKVVFTVQPLFHLIGSQLLSQNDSKATPAGPAAHCFLQHLCRLVKGRSWFTGQRALWVPPPRTEHHKMTFFKYVGVFISQRLCQFCERGKGVRAPLKDHPSHLVSWAVRLLNAIFPLLFLPTLFAGPLSCPAGSLYYTAHSSWHTLSVLSGTLWRVRSLWVLLPFFQVNRFTFKASSPRLLCLGRHWSVSSLQLSPHPT